MRIHTDITWDIATGTVIADEFYEYSGPVELCKGDDQKAQLNLQNQLEAQQQASQDAELQSINTAISPLLSGNTGFTTPQLAAMYSSAINQNAQKYNAATQATNAQLAARGENGMSPASGVSANGYGNLQAARASDLSSALNNVVLNNAQQGQSNRLNAASILSGNAQTYAGNVGTYGSGASSALNNLTQIQQSGFWNNFAKGLGGGLAGAASSALTGGFGSFLSPGIPGATTSSSSTGDENYGF